MDRRSQCAIITVLSIGLLLTVILVPISLGHIEYYEYGIKMRKATGRIDDRRVYSNGRYSIGPGNKFIKYQADAHFESFDSLSVFSDGASNSSIGLEFLVDVDFTYFLKKDELVDLHREMSRSYQAVISSRAKDAIKNEAPKVSFTEYFQNRRDVEQRFRAAVERRWAETNVHCQLDQFRLGRIRIPESVARKQLESRIQNERNEEESFVQQAQIERQMTAVQVNSILLEKERVLRNARAEASLIQARAQAEAQKILAEAQVNGTSLLFTAVDVSSQEHMTAFTYIRNLARRQNIELTLNYINPENVQPTAVV